MKRRNAGARRQARFTPGSGYQIIVAQTQAGAGRSAALSICAAAFGIAAGG